MSQDLDQFFETLETKQHREHEDAPFIYVGQPYSHEDPEIVAMRVDQIVQVVMKIETAYPSARVYSPILNTHPLAKENYHPKVGWYFHDVQRWLSYADHLIAAQLEGWQESSGLLIEIAFALGRGIPIYFMKPDGDVPSLDLGEDYDYGSDILLLEDDEDESDENELDDLYEARIVAQMAQIEKWSQFSNFTETELREKAIEMIEDDIPF